MRILVLICCALISGSQPDQTGPAQPQQAAPAEAQAQAPAQAQILVLGTFHFAGGADQIQTAARDILGEEAQREILALVDALERFKPHKICVEYPAADQPELDGIYQAYLAGRRASSTNERDQLAFRLAQRLGHARVYALDHPANMDFPALMRCAQETGRPDLIEGFQRQIGRITAWIDHMQSRTIVEEFAVINHPRHDEYGHRCYMGLLDFDTADRNPAEALLVGWYQRNLKSHATLRRIAEPGDRVLVVIGAAHTKHLRDLVDQDPATVGVNPADYLPPIPQQPLNDALDQLGAIANNPR